MSKFSELKKYSGLAWASYKNIDSNIEDTLLCSFVETKYRILSSSSGFQAILYKNNNEYVLAIRGTEIKGDILNDLIIADGNLALNSIPSGQLLIWLNL